MCRIVGGCSGYVNCVHADGTFDINIRFTISCTVEKNVHPRRILNTNPLATSARRISSINDDAATGLPLVSRLCPASLGWPHISNYSCGRCFNNYRNQLLVTIIFDRCPFTFIKFSYIVLIGTRSEVWRIHLWLCWSGERSGDQQVGGRGWKILVSRSGGEGHNKRACLQTDGT